MKDCMRINTNPGEKVKVTEWSIGNGMTGDNRKGLEVGKIYTIRKIDVDNWNTTVRLEELPGYFNSVLFENANSI